MIYIRNDGTFVVDGYHVVSKDIDPYNKYDIEEIKQYTKDHPEEVAKEPVYDDKDPRFIDIDLRSVRALRAILIGTPSSGDMETLKKLELEAIELRKEKE